VLAECMCIVMREEMLRHLAEHCRDGNQAEHDQRRPEHEQASHEYTQPVDLAHAGQARNAGEEGEHGRHQRKQRKAQHARGNQQPVTVMTFHADRLHFALSDAQMSRFLEALEAPMPDDAALRELLARTPQWLR